MTKSTYNTEPTYIDITFQNGVAVMLNNKEFTSLGISTILSRIAVDCGLSKDVENSIIPVALKSLSDKLSCGSDSVNGVVKMKLYNGAAVPFAYAM